MFSPCGYRWGLLALAVYSEFSVISGADRLNMKHLMKSRPMQCPRLSRISKLLLIIPLVLLFPVKQSSSTSNTALEGYYLSAAHLQKLCGGDTSGSYFKTKAGARSYCLGFLGSVADSYNWREAKGGWEFCVDTKFKLETARDLYADFLKTNVKSEKKSAVTVIAHTLANQYPCVDDKPQKIPSIIDIKNVQKSCFDPSDEVGMGFCFGFLEGTREALDNWPNELGRRFCIGENWAEYHFLPHIAVPKGARKIWLDFVVSMDVRTSFKSALEHVIRLYAIRFRCEA